MGEIVIHISKKEISYEEYQQLKQEIEDKYKEEDGYKVEINYYE